MSQNISDGNNEIVYFSSSKNIKPHICTPDQARKIDVFKDVYKSSSKIYDRILFQKIIPNNHCIITIPFNTGFRLEEILQNPDINPDDIQRYIIYSIDEKHKKQQAILDGIVFEYSTELFKKVTSKKQELEMVGKYDKNSTLIGYDMIFVDL